MGGGVTNALHRGPILNEPELCQSMHVGEVNLGWIFGMVYFSVYISQWRVSSSTGK